jgi:hypothetical protein
MRFVLSQVRRKNKDAPNLGHQILVQNQTVTALVLFHRMVFVIVGPGELAAKAVRARFRAMDVLRMQFLCTHCDMSMHTLCVAAQRRQKNE